MKSIKTIILENIKTVVALITIIVVGYTLVNGWNKMIDERTKVEMKKLREERLQKDRPPTIAEKKAECKKWTDAVKFYEATMYGLERTSDGEYIEYLERKQWRDEACKK